MGRPAGSKNKPKLPGGGLKPDEVMSFASLGGGEGGGVVSSAAVVNFLEYDAPTGERWRVELGGELMREFDLVADEVGRFHERMAVSERTWRVLRMRYGISPLVGGWNADFVSGLSDDAIALKLQTSPEQVRAEVAGAVAFWRKNEVLAASAAATAAREVDVVSDAEAEDLLMVYGFDPEDYDSVDLRFIAGRIRDMRHHLEMEQRRPLAMNAIRQELLLNTLDADIQRVKRNNPLKKAVSGMNLSDLMKERRAQQSQYEKTLESLGETEDQNPSVRRKLEFVDCLATLVSGMQEYYARGDRTLIDGMFTAAEVELLIRPQELRPAQYRADIVVVVNDAMQEHNLFDPSYTPPVMPRAVYRRFQRAWGRAVSALESDEASYEDADELEDSDEDDAGRSSGAESVAGDAPGMMAAAPVSEPVRRRVSAADVDFVAG